jgi:hypothetical protein
MSSVTAAVSQKVSSGSLKAVALNWMASGAMATTAAAKKAAKRPPPSRRASCAVSGMSSSERRQPRRPLHRAEEGVEERLAIEQQRRLVHRLGQQQRVAPDSDEPRPRGE